jgi:hypothetical protein
MLSILWLNQRHLAGSSAIHPWRPVLATWRRSSNVACGHYRQNNAHLQRHGRTWRCRNGLPRQGREGENVSVSATASRACRRPREGASEDGVAEAERCDFLAITSNFVTKENKKCKSKDHQSFPL